jgi:probable HAF family extracellular repeat protein
MTDIGTTGSDSWAEKIGGNRLAIGQGYTPSGFRHGLAWNRRSGAIDLGTLGGDTSYADAVSDLGTVVGGSWTAGNAMWRAFVWTTESGMVALEGSFDGRSEAIAIANHLIAGYSCTADGLACHATLWKPAHHSSR